jgi:glycosyltransferase involved in cell wall biosynthesis
LPHDVPPPAARVLQVVLSLNPGGTERLVLDLAMRLHGECPMAICCLDDAGAWASQLTSQGIAVTALERAPGFHPSLARGVARAAIEHRATVIHAHHYSPFVYSALARLAGTSAAVIFTEHGRLSDVGPSPKRRFANRALARRAYAACAVSEDVKRHLVGEGFAAASVQVIYNGIDVGPLPTAEQRLTARAALGFAETACVVGTIARLDPVKDLSTLVAAIARASSAEDLHLVVVGDGPERDRIEQDIRRLNIDTRVRLLGMRDDARYWLAACDIYANSSISEGVSLTILEAMAAGLPVVATSVGGTPEVIDDTCGRLVMARDVTALSEAILTLATAPELRRRQAREARRRVETRFTLGQMIESYRQLYLASPGI